MRKPWVGLAVRLGNYVRARIQQTDLDERIRERMRNLIGVADGVKLSESAPLQVALAGFCGFLPVFLVSSFGSRDAQLEAELGLASGAAAGAGSM